MPWVEKHRSISMDQQPVDGLFYLDGDQLAYWTEKPWTEGQKYPLIIFPSGQECDLFETRNPADIGIVHIFGEMDLPLVHQRNDAFLQAQNIAEQCGYAVSKIGENRLEVWGHDVDEHFVLHYNNENQRLVDVIAVKNETPPTQPAHVLLPLEIREQLPELYSTDEQDWQAKAIVKYFTPDAGWTWYATEFDGKDLFFGLVVGLEIELGYFSLAELQEVRGHLNLPIERDLYFEQQTLEEIKRWHEKHS